MQPRVRASPRSHDERCEQPFLLGQAGPGAFSVRTAIGCDLTIALFVATGASVLVRAGDEPSVMHWLHWLAIEARVLFALLWWTSHHISIIKKRRRHATLGTPAAAVALWWPCKEDSRCQQLYQIVSRYVSADEVRSSTILRERHSTKSYSECFDSSSTNLVP